MSTTPVAPIDEELESVRGRVAERFGSAPEILGRLPRDVLRDTALNLSRGFDGDAALLPRGDRLLVALGVATAHGAHGFGAWLAQAAQAVGKSLAETEAARAVGVTCTTYNGYYKFRALLDESAQGAFAGFQAALRATPFVRSPLSKALVELICVAVSVQNACSHCVRGHVESARGAGASDGAIDEAVRAGAVAGGLARFEGAH